MGAIPMVQIGPVIVVTFGDEIDDQTALRLQADVGEVVVRKRATGVLLDISALDLVDSFICKVLGDTAGIVRVLGAQVSLVGMRPAVAITLVELGLPLAGINTALNLDLALAALSRASSAPRLPEFWEHSD